MQMQVNELIHDLFNASLAGRKLVLGDRQSRNALFYRLLYQAVNSDSAVTEWTIE